MDDGESNWSSIRPRDSELSVTSTPASVRPDRTTSPTPQAPQEQIPLVGLPGSRSSGEGGREGRELLLHRRADARVGALSPRLLERIEPLLPSGHLEQLLFERLLLLLQREPLLCVELGENVAALAVVLEHVAVVLPQRRPVRDGEHGDAELGGVVVHDLLDLERDGRGALVQDGVLGLVVEEARHGDALLVAARKSVAPLALHVPAALACDNVLDLQHAQNVQQVLVGLAARTHLLRRVWVNDLVSERAEREVGTLRDVGELGRGWLLDRAAVHGPETTEDAEERALAASVGADDEQVLARLHVEAQLGHENVAVGADDGHVAELDAGRARGVLLDRAASLQHQGVLLDRSRRDELLLELASLDGVHGVEKLRDTRSVACELRDLLVRVHDSAKGVGGGEQETTVGDKGLGARAEIQALAAARQTHKHGHGADAQAESAPEPLDDAFLGHAVDDADAVDAIDVLDERKVGALDDVLLGRLAAEEGDLFCVLDEARVVEAELALELLLGGGVLAEGRRELAQQRGRARDEDVDADERLGSDAAHELVVVQADVQDGFGKVAVDLGERFAELCHVDGDELVCILDAIVEVAELVEGHVGEVGVVDALCEAAAVRKGELGLEELDHGVGVGGRYGDGHPPEDAGDELAGLGSDKGGDDAAVEICDVEREHGSQNEEEGVEHEEASLLGAPAGDDDAKDAL
ncbi:hypothetical protein L1887_48581 [Cichorium endivia]|nr:hypothetical protein L1887_48581 [Cichorium endivia]